jgi:hypothetical protein
MIKIIYEMLTFHRDPRIEEIVRLQRKINDLVPETRLGVLFRRRWGRGKVVISYQSEYGVEHLIEFDLNTAYWYVQGIAGGMCNLSRRKSLN